MMEVTEIVRQLGESELLPTDALKAAIAQIEQVTPAFLAILEDFAGGGGVVSDGRSPLLLVVHLLAEFEEQRAFAPLIRFLRSDPEAVEAEFGDATTETLSRVLISFYDGNLGILQKMILDPQFDEFVRFGETMAMAYLTKVGKIHPESTELFLSECRQKLPMDCQDYGWVGWQNAISLLGLESLAPLVREVFED